MQYNNKYEVIIAGGGLAGLTLALQLKHHNPNVSILVIEKRENDASAATHKVGESLSEIGAYYLREVIGLKEYLTQHQLRKFGFRFFFSPEHSNDISKRVEVGSKLDNPFPSHQVDRGLLENELVSRAKEKGIVVAMGSVIKDVELSKKGHTVYYTSKGEENKEATKWFIDATGRRGLLKRKLGLEKGIGHDINAAWFRIDWPIDVDGWSENLEWRSFVSPGRRRLATNHLMGKGYWVWIIPLVNGKTSLGIVADPRFHAFDTFNNYEKALQWLKTFEPQAYQKFTEPRGKLLDFKLMRSFAYDTKQFYGGDRWALTGEAGAFMDPFYSPGSDMIAFGNCWITDLISRELKGEDLRLRTMIYNHAHKELVNGWIHLYRNMYEVFGNTQVMLLKIVWDWASYWAVPAVLSMNNSYTDLSFLKKYSSNEKGIGRKFADLNLNMQQLLLCWNKYDVAPVSAKQLNVFDLECLRRFQLELGQQYNPTELISKIEANLTILEEVFAEIFRLISRCVNDTPADLKVDPYNMVLDDGKEKLISKSVHENALGINGCIQEDIKKMWFVTMKTPANEPA